MLAEIKRGLLPSVLALSTILLSAAPADAFCEWKPVETVNPPFLVATSASSDADVWAVGSGLLGYEAAVHFDGTTWTTTPTPNQMTTAYGVSTSGPTDAWMVGDYDTPYYRQTRAEHWDGKSWTLITTPTISYVASFSAVKTFGATNAWAVGWMRAPSACGGVLVEHWNGVRWKIQNLNLPACGYMDSVDGFASDLWAVGWIRGDRLRYLTGAWHFNGGSWRRVSTPNVAYVPGTNRFKDMLNGVSVLRDGTAWAVGYYFLRAPNNPNRKRPLAEFWNGSAWRVVPIPDRDGAASDWLSAVTAVAPNDVWAVGTHQPKIPGQVSAIIEHWNGRSWERVETHLNKHAQSELFGVTALGPDDVWATGSGEPYNNNAAEVNSQPTFDRFSCSARIAGSNLR